LSSGNYEELKTEEDYRKSVEEIFKKINEEFDLIVHRVVHGGELRKLKNK